MHHARRSALLPVMFLLCSVAFAQEKPEPRNLAVLFPADTMLYVEVPSLPEFIKASRATGVVGLWDDPSMLAIKTYVELTSGPSVDSRDALTIFRALRQFALAVPGSAAFGLVPGTGGPQWLAVIEVGPDPSAARAFLDLVYAREARIGRPASQQEINGVTVSVSGVDDEYSAITDGLLLLGTRELFVNTLERVTGKSNAASLASLVNFSKALSFLSGDPEYRMYLNFPLALDQLRQVVPASSPVDVGALLEDFGVDEIDTLSIEGTFRNTGIVEHLYISTASADSTLLSLAGRGAVDESRLVLVPRDVFFFGARSTDAATAYATWKKVSQTALSVLGFDMTSVISSLEQKCGVSIARDILPALGKNSIAYISLTDKLPAPVIPFFGGLERVTLFEVTDEKALLAAIDRIVSYAQLNPQFLAEIAPPGTLAPPTIETISLGTVRLVYLSVKGMPFFTPTVAVYGKYLIYADSTDAVKRAIDNIIAPGPSILDADDYSRVRAVLAKAPTQLAYLALDRMVDMFYDHAVPFFTRSLDAAAVNGTAPFKSSDIPPRQVAKRYIDGVGMSMVTSGNLIDIQAYSPFGFAPLAAPVAFFALAGPGALPAVSADSADEAPRMRLREIGRALQVSTIEQKGLFPEALADVLPPEMLQAPQDPAPDSPVDYEYVRGLSSSSPGSRLLVYERKGLNPDGRYVLFVDGTVQFLSEADFQTLLGEQR